VYGIDYLETYSPVAKLTSIRILFAIATVKDLEIHQMDAVTGFLAEHIDEEIYMDQPEGFIIVKNGKRLVCRIRKGLYGLKQSARLWNQKIRRILESHGFVSTHADHCIYINKEMGVIIAIWVDDLIIFGKGMDGIEKIKTQLNGELEMKDLGEMHFFLGIQVHRDRQNRQLSINQTSYINSILGRFEMANCKSASTPMAVGTKLKKATTDDILVDQRHYQSIVGSVMYPILCTRPDVAFAIS